MRDAGIEVRDAQQSVVNKSFDRIRRTGRSGHQDAALSKQRPVEWFLHHNTHGSVPLPRLLRPPLATFGRRLRIVAINDDDIGRLAFASLARGGHAF